jgi:hypothetical protein
MPIVRVHKKAGRFKVIDKTCVQDSRLSFAARGLHTLLLTKPDNWQVNVKHLLKQCPPEFGEKHVYNCLKELKAYGYMQMKRLGTGGVVYHIYETPELAETSEISTLPLGQSGSEESEPTLPKATFPKPTSGLGESGIKDIKERFATEKEKERFTTDSLTQNARARANSPPEERERTTKHSKETRRAYLRNHPGITKPDGWMFNSRDGRYDELIDTWLEESAQPHAPPPSRDVSLCPDCHGSGQYYPDGYANGVRKCKHERLKAA